MRLLVEAIGLLMVEDRAVLAVLYCLSECFLRRVLFAILEDLLHYNASYILNGIQICRICWPHNQSVAFESHRGEQLCGYLVSMCWRLSCIQIIF